jgi:outer membrane protein
MKDIGEACCYTSHTIMKRSVLLAFSCLAAISTYAEAASARVLSLQEAVDSALAGGDDMKIAMATLDTAKAQHALNLSKQGVSLAAAGSYAPTKGYGDAFESANSTVSKAAASLAGASYGLYQTFGGQLIASLGGSSSSFTSLSLGAQQTVPEDKTGSVGTTKITASLSQTLWDGYPGGQFRAAIAKSALALRTSELTAAQAKWAVVSNVKQAYATMLGAQRTLSLNEGIREKFGSQLKQYQLQYSLKQVSEIDLKNAEVNARKADLDAEDARRSLELSRRSLAALMGLPPDSSFEVGELDDLPMPASSADEAVSIGLAKRVELAKAGLGRKSSEVDLALAKAGRQPTVAVTAGLTLGTLQDYAEGNADAASVGFSVKLPLLDAGAASAQAAAAKAQILSSDAQAAQLATGIETSIRDAYWNADLLFRRVDVAKETREVYEKKLALMEVQNKAGTATNWDLLSAQVDAATYEAAYLAAQIAYFKAELALETAMGQ